MRYKEVDPLRDETGLYWSLQIENYGRTVAKDCIATITLIGISEKDILSAEKISLSENLPQYRNESIDLATPREQIVSASHFRPLKRTSLCWAKLGNPDKIDINPGVSQSVDLCKYQIGDEINYFIFPSEMGWRRLRVRLTGKKISGYVLICLSNEFPTRVNIVLSVRADGISDLRVKKPSILERIRRNKYE